MSATMYVVTEIELDGKELKEKLTVCADVQFEPDGIGLKLGPIRGWLRCSDGGTVEMPLTEWEKVQARTTIELRFLEMHGIAWEDRAA